MCALILEAEWEYAARGGQTTKYYWGDDYDLADDYENMNSATLDTLKSKNQFGLYNTFGFPQEFLSGKSVVESGSNVLASHEETYTSFYGTSGVVDPIVNSDGTQGLITTGKVDSYVAVFIINFARDIVVGEPSVRLVRPIR